MTTYLGLDLGTSELKALLLRNDHTVIATAGAPLTVWRPQPLWSEQHPADWWAACENVMQQLRREQPQALADVAAIGLSGQMHGAVLMDAQGEVLRPAMLWNDGRSAAQCERLNQRVITLPLVTGNLAMPGFTAPKLLWVHEHEPDVFAKVARVLLPKDWLRFMLGGEAVSDMSDAAGTLWLDVARRRWSTTMLDATGLTEAQMPRLVEGSAVSARLHDALAKQWGLREGVVIAGGGGDNAASAVGMGCVSPGQGFVSLGTSGVIFVADDRYAPNPRSVSSALHTFCHALPGRWHRMSVMLSAASAVTWAARALAFADEASLLAEAASLSAADRETAPFFMPYLGGERTPHNDPTLTAAWQGVTHAHDRAALAYAVVEGVSFGLKDGWLAFGDAPPATALSAVGGGARSDFWLQMLADVLNVAIVRHEGAAIGGALGAARLAWLSDGGVEAQVCTQPPVAQVFEAQAVERALMATRHARFAGR
jgi:xylulokinase